MATKKTSTKSTGAAAKKPATTKATTAKKPAARKTATKTGSAGTKRGSKATSSRTAARKPAAKKPAARKPAAKKPAAKSAAQSAPAPAVGGTEKIKQYNFKVGDKVVYPHHGAAVIVKKEKHPVDGKKVDYFVLEVATDQLTVRVPVSRASELGTRPVISKNQARKVFAVFKEEPQEAGSNWSRWYKVLTEKINSGDIYQVAEVVRDLTYAQQTKGISPALKRMLSKALLILSSELRFALNVSEEEAMKRIERALPVVEDAAT